MIFDAYVKLCKAKINLNSGLFLMYTLFMETKQGNKMKSGDTVFLIVRDATGRAVNCDLCKIVSFYAAVAIVQQDGKEFKVFTSNLR